jgi:nucleoid-associated protein YgaU
MYLRSGDSFPTAAGDGRIVSVRDNKVRLVTPTGNVNLTTSSVRTTRVVAQTSPEPAAGSSVALKPGVSSSGRYTVQKGDNLWRISMRLYGTPHMAAQIAKANGLRNASIIVIGQSLALPGAAATGPAPVAGPVVQVATAKKPVSASSTNVSNPAKPSNVVVKPSNGTANKSGEVVLYKVKPGDTLYGISRKFYGSHFDAGKIAKANNLGNPNKLKPDSVLRIQLQ